jgi:hypothetical protein
MIVEANDSLIQNFSELASSNDRLNRAEAEDAATYGALTMKELVDGDLLLRFVSAEKAPYYQEKFQDIVKASGIEDVQLHDVSWKTLIRGVKGTSIGFLRMLPFTKRTVYNWPAGLFNVFWGVWRGIAYKWWLVATFMTAIVFDSILEHFTGYSFWTYGSFALLPLFAICGNSAFLFGIVRELRTGNVRKQPTSAGDLILSIVLFLVICVGAVVVFPAP